jgi:hypothetical protein
MCFSAPKQPAPQAPPPPPTARDANIDATRQRQEQAKRAKISGFEASMTSGPGGVTGAAPIGKPSLGA